MRPTLLKRSRLAAATIAAMALSSLALAQTATPAASSSAQNEDSKEESKELEAVQVVGSRISRTEVEGPAPVTIITRDQMDRQGYTTVADVLSSLNEVTGSVQNELTQNGFTPNATVINLRGLGPGRVLTLIDGRRVAEYPRPYNSQSNFVNLGAIPAVAVERIEVLTGGASAIYGSDAVAGVVNVILRKDFDGNRISLQTGFPTRGGAETADLQFLGGKTWDRGDLVYAFQYYNRGAIYAAERDFMDSYRDDPSTSNPQAVEGLRIRNRSAAPIQGFTPRFLPAGRTIDQVCGQFGGAFETYDAGLVAGNTLSSGPSCAYWGYPATQAIRNSDATYAGYIRGSFAINDNLDAYGSISVYDATAQTASATEFISVGAMVAGREARTDVIYDTRLGRFIDFQRIFTPVETGGFGNRGTRYEEQTYDISAGLRGVMAERFDWDFTLSNSRYTSDTRRPRLLKDPTIAFFLGPRLGSALGRGAYAFNYERFLRPLTPEEFDSISTTVITSAESKATQGTFVVNGSLWEMGGGSVGFAGSLEAARQSYSLNPDPRTLPGQTDIVNLVDTGGGGSRDRYALGAELRLPFTNSFTANLAARYDTYDDATNVDGAGTYNLGLEWRPTEDLLVRGSYATSFRAPDMHFVYAGPSGFFTTYFDEFNCRADGFNVTQCGNNPEYVYQAAGTRQGNLGLAEEEGNSYTVGLVWDITSDLSMSVDYFNIELEGVVDDDITSLLNTEANCRLGQDRNGNTVDPTSALCLDALARVTRATGLNGDLVITSVNTSPKNTAFLGTDGIDATLNYRLDTESRGEFSFSLAYTHVLGQQFQEFAEDPVLEYRDDPTNFDFRSRVRGSVFWNYKDLAMGASFVRVGSLPNWAETDRIAPFITWNLTANYDLFENFNVGLNVNNVFDRIAPQDGTFNSYPYFWRAFSPIGREVFVNLNYRF